MVANEGKILAQSAAAAANPGEVCGDWSCRSVTAGDIATFLSSLGWRHLLLLYSVDSIN